MNSFKEKYYGDKRVAAVVSREAYLGLGYFADEPMDIDYFIYAPNGKFKYQGFCQYPTDYDENGEVFEPNCYFDKYRDVLEYGLKAYVVDGIDVYKDDEDSIGRFNAKYKTNFATFSEIYDYATNDKQGLGFYGAVVLNPISSI